MSNLEVRLAAVEALLKERLHPSRPLNSIEAARYLHVSLSTLYKLTSRSAIPHYKSAGGKLISFQRADLDAYLLHDRVMSVAEIEQDVRRARQ